MLYSVVLSVKDQIIVGNKLHVRKMCVSTCGGDSAPDASWLITVIQDIHHLVQKG